MKSKNTTIKIIKGFSSAYPNICNLKLLPNIDGGWITIQDDVGTSMTIKLSDLGDFICCDAIDAIKAEIEEVGYAKDEYGDIHADVLRVGQVLNIIEKNTSGGAE